MTDTNPPSLIERVFELAGGRSVLMEALGLSKQSMSDWVRDGVVPVKHCPAVSRLTGLKLKELNPDGFTVAQPVKRAKRNRGE